jgi:hypothetical protein
MNTQTQLNKELLQYTIDRLEDYKGADIYACDLHNEIFNTDYYIIGRYKAAQWLAALDGGVFCAIGEIKEYEETNFGKLTTDISDPEKVVNMYVYIKGEEILSQSETLQSKWDDKLTAEDYTAIINELKALL